MSFIIGSIIGSVMTAVMVILLVLRNHNFGALRIDRSEPNEPPYIFLELYADPSEIMQKKYVMLEVKNEDFITHK